MGRLITEEARRRLATGWDPRVSTLRDYARQNDVSERAIRNWRARLRHERGTAVPGGKVVVPLQATVDALQARLEELEAAVDAARAAVADARAMLDAAEAPGDMPAGTETAGDAKPARPAPVERKPMPPPGVFWC